MAVKLDQVKLCYETKLITNSKAPQHIASQVSFSIMSQLHVMLETAILLRAHEWHFIGKVAAVVAAVANSTARGAPSRL